MNLELSLLESYLVLVETEHFGRAAERLNISQPALTKQIQRLEDRLGGALIERDTRSFRLTPAGFVLKQSAESLMAGAREAERRLEVALKGKAGFLRVGFGTATLSAGLGSLLREHRRRFPEIEVSLKDMSSPAQLQALESEEIDVGFVRLPVANPTLETIPLLEERLVLAAAEEYLSPERRQLSDFSAYPFVAIQRGISTSFNDHLFRTCQAAGFTPRIVQEAAELLTLVHLVEAGLGVALVPSASVRMGVHHVRWLETGIEEAKWKIGITRVRSDSNPLVQNFVSLALELFQHTD